MEQEVKMTEEELKNSLIEKEGTQEATSEEPEWASSGEPDPEPSEWIQSDAEWVSSECEW